MITLLSVIVVCLFSTVTVLGVTALYLPYKDKWRKGGRITAATYHEQKRVLERDRREWAATLNSKTSTQHKKEGATKQLALIDKQLLALAERVQDEPEQEA